MDEALETKRIRQIGDVIHDHKLSNCSIFKNNNVITTSCQTPEDV